jgi:hypothetical protein
VDAQVDLDTIDGHTSFEPLECQSSRHRPRNRAEAGGQGAEVVVGDLLEPADVYRVVTGCWRVYFGMSVSAGYLEAIVTNSAVAREFGVNALVNMSQMTVSEMSIQQHHAEPSAAAALAQR